MRTNSREALPPILSFMLSFALTFVVWGLVCFFGFHVFGMLSQHPAIVPIYFCCGAVFAFFLLGLHEPESSYRIGAWCYLQSSIYLGMASMIVVLVLMRPLQSEMPIMAWSLLCGAMGSGWGMTVATRHFDFGKNCGHDLVLKPGEYVCQDCRDLGNEKG